MNILVIGSGGREHAIVKKISESKRVSKIYCAPGNGGISDIAECVPIKVMEFDKLIDFAKEKSIDLTVVGPDDPLVYGISDAFKAAGLKVFGPTKDGAQIEGSKVFSKELMKKYNVKRCYYGHLHGVSIADAVEGTIEGIDFKLVSADKLNFIPFPVIS